MRQGHPAFEVRGFTAAGHPSKPTGTTRRSARSPATRFVPRLGARPDHLKNCRWSAGSRLVSAPASPTAAEPTPVLASERTAPGLRSPPPLSRARPDWPPLEPACSSHPPCCRSPPGLTPIRPRDIAAPAADSLTQVAHTLRLRIQEDTYEPEIKNGQLSAFGQV